jgi:hypothetical protein
LSNTFVSNDSAKNSSRLKEFPEQTVNSHDHNLPEICRKKIDSEDMSANCRLTLLPIRKLTAVFETGKECRGVEPISSSIERLEKPRSGISSGNALSELQKSYLRALPDTATIVPARTLLPFGIFLRPAFNPS